jgi:hypothetical protein
MRVDAAAARHGGFRRADPNLLFRALRCARSVAGIKGDEVGDGQA